MKNHKKKNATICDGLSFWPVVAVAAATAVNFTAVNWVPFD